MLALRYSPPSGYYARMPRTRIYKSDAEKQAAYRKPRTRAAPTASGSEIRSAFIDLRELHCPSGSADNRTEEYDQKERRITVLDDRSSIRNSIVRSTNLAETLDDDRNWMVDE
jgi:hypothetical protein